MTDLPLPEIKFIESEFPLGFKDEKPCCGIAISFEFSGVRLRNAVQLPCSLKDLGRVEKRRAVMQLLDWLHATLPVHTLGDSWND